MTRRRRPLTVVTLAVASLFASPLLAVGNPPAAAASLTPALSPGPPPPAAHALPPAPPAGLAAFKFGPPRSHPADAPTKPTFRPKSQDDFDLADVALVTTLDGRVHALRRETGQWVWTLHDPGGKSDDLVRDSLVSAKRFQPDGNATGAPSLVAHHPPRPSDPDDADVDEEDIYAIEPHSDGDIYVYMTARGGGGGTLQKLPLSVSELVNLSPFTFPGDQSKLFVGKKETRLVGVDLKTGKLVGVFGPGQGWCEWKDSPLGGSECDDEISSRPQDMLYMGRTDYQLSIYSKPGGLLQTLRYSTYGPSNLGDDLQAGWTRTPDERYLEPMHDGNLVCYRAGDGMSGQAGLQWRNSFDCPVTSVFDIAYPKPEQGDDLGIAATPSPVMFQQPRPLPTAGVTPSGPFDHLPRGSGDFADKAFLGRHGDSYFAMSRQHFPLVAFAPQALSDPTKASKSQSHDKTRQSTFDGIVGTHSLESTEAPPGPGQNLLDAQEPRLGIDPPPEQAINAHPNTRAANLSPHPSVATEKSNGIPSLIARKVRDQLSLSSRDAREETYGTNPLLSIVFIMMLLGWISARKSWGSKWDRELEKRVKKVGRDWFGVGAGILTEEERRAIEKEAAVKSLLGEEASEIKRPISPDVSTVAAAPPATPSVVVTSDERQPLASSSTTNTAAPIKRVRIVSMTKALPSVPVDEEVDDARDGEEESEEVDDKENKDDGNNGAGNKSKRPRRTRKRGRRPGQKAAAAAAAAAAAGASIEAGALGGAEEQDLSKLAPRGATKVEPPPGSPILGAFEPYRVGSLIVTDETLGYGSHGTVVVKGTFQGREVAVKRLLKDFVTLATHEVALLQESDDHPNVVRYFVKESRDNFLYIALELCPASLFDVIERSKVYPELEAAFSPKLALQQITAGLRHLHKLKIVHRDIKPQNILVALKNRGGRRGDAIGLRMLISDFGLCKKLEVDESSFAQTASHAAGSFGYRAPEILKGQVNPNDSSMTPSSSISGMSASEGGGSSPPLGASVATETTHRLTRSIDIFSLGCIFYYVLTKGEHPFGNRYEREVNILKDQVNLEQLDGFDEEAHEAQTLIGQMVTSNPKSRPSADDVWLHPYFWNASRRLIFLCEASDRFEIMERDPPTSSLEALEQGKQVVVAGDWYKKIDRSLVDNLGKYRKYDGQSIRDLLRVLRNKKHHFQDLPETVKKTLGEPPEAFLCYFTRRFPSLLLHIYSIVSIHLKHEAMFTPYFTISEDV